MSQFFQNVSNSSIPSDVATSYVTDNGTAVPSAHILNVLGNETNVNNDNGIQTSGSGNTVTVQLTNRVTGTVTTTDATPTTIISFSMGSTPGVYLAEGDVIAFDVTDTAGGCYTFIGAARTDGASGTEIAVENKNIFEEAAMATADFTFSISGNTAILQVIGIAGKTIHWNSLFTFRFVS